MLFVELLVECFQSCWIWPVCFLVRSYKSLLNLASTSLRLGHCYVGIYSKNSFTFSFSELYFLWFIQVVEDGYQFFQKRKVSCVHIVLEDICHADVNLVMWNWRTVYMRSVSGIWFAMTNARAYNKSTEIITVCIF